MSDHWQEVRAAFRLDLDQQKKQARELLEAAKAADAAALLRMSRQLPEAPEKLRQNSLRLADARYVIARELRFANWPELEAHIQSLDQARAAIRSRQGAPDADLWTLHLRCGSDIRATLADAGFCGDFLEVSYPYCHGPVSAGPDRFEREARYLVDFAGAHKGIGYQEALAWRREEERRLLASAVDYERVVLWKEHDCYDQFVLLRCLAHYARAARPRVLELINIDHFPGRRADGRPIHFLGLGQLPEEALRLLWHRRRPVTPAQLALAAEAWDALARDDPRPLVALMRGATAALPYLGPALRRFVQELPSVKEGLSLTERLLLQILSEQDVSLNHLFDLMTHQRDPLFFATDLKMMEIVEYLARLPEALLTRRPGDGAWQDVVSITEAGRSVLRGERDFLSLRPPARWVGGVQIRPGQSNWRWDEAAQRAILMEPGG